MNLAVQSVGPEAGRIAVVLHGILGSAKNWRTMARKMSAAWPEWRFLLVDLRNHGESWRPDGAQSLSDVARDLEEITHRFGPPAALIGHSYGGKVAMQRACLAPIGLESVWILDSRLDAVGELPAHNEVRQVFETLALVPGPFESRAAAAAELEARGLAKPIIAWMGTNLMRAEDGVRWRFDLDGAARMLQDYLKIDLVPELGRTDVDVHLVRAVGSGRWADDVVAQLDEEERQGRLVQHRIESGHWIHVDAPGALIDAMSVTFA